MAIDRTPELEREIFDRIARGETIRHICAQEHLPSHETLYRWIREDAGFREQYARAKESQSDYFAEELIDIADDGMNDWIERESQRTGVPYIALNDEAIARSRLRIETRKWLMGKMKPKKYGDTTRLQALDEKGEPTNPTQNVTALVLKHLPTEALDEILKEEKDNG